MYEISLEYDDDVLGNGFFRAIDEAYCYMQDYMQGDDGPSPNLLACAEYYCNRYDDDDSPVLKTDAWAKQFELDHSIGELPIIKKGIHVHKHIQEIPFKGFEFLAMADKFESGQVKPLKGLNKEVKLAKQWALIALLEMQRRNCTSC